MNKKVAEKVCKYFNISLEELTSDSTLHTTSRARAVYSYIMHQRGVDAVTIALDMNRDRTTILYYLRNENHENLANKIMGRSYQTTEVIEWYTEMNAPEMYNDWDEKSPEVIAYDKQGFMGVLVFDYESREWEDQITKQKIYHKFYWHYPLR